MWDQKSGDYLGMCDCLGTMWLFGGQKLPEKPQIQSCITQFLKNNKNNMLDDWKKSSFFFFWNPSRTQIVTWGQKGFWVCVWLFGMWLFQDTTVSYFKKLKFWTWNRTYWRLYLQILSASYLDCSKIHFYREPIFRHLVRQRKQPGSESNRPIFGRKSRKGLSR